MKTFRSAEEDKDSRNGTGAVREVGNDRKRYKWCADGRADFPPARRCNFNVRTVHVVIVIMKGREGTSFLDQFENVSTSRKWKSVYDSSPFFAIEGYSLGWQGSPPASLKTSPSSYFHSIDLVTSSPFIHWYCLWKPMIAALQSRRISVFHISLPFTGFHAPCQISIQRILRNTTVFKAHIPPCTSSPVFFTFKSSIDLCQRFISGWGLILEEGNILSARRPPRRSPRRELTARESRIRRRH